jgi:hypothetical protein
MKLEIWKNDIRGSKLKPGLYFAEPDELGMMLRLVDRKTDIPVRIYSENGEYYADVPDDIANEIKVGEGRRLEIISPKDSGWGYIAMIVV